MNCFPISVHPKRIVFMFLALVNKKSMCQPQVCWKYYWRHRELVHTFFDWINSIIISIVLKAGAFSLIFQSRSPHLKVNILYINGKKGLHDYLKKPKCYRFWCLKINKKLSIWKISVVRRLAIVFGCVYNIIHCKSRSNWVVKSKKTLIDSQILFKKIHVVLKKLLHS